MGGRGGEGIGGGGVLRVKIYGRRAGGRVAQGVGPIRKKKKAGLFSSP